MKKKIFQRMIVMAFLSCSLYLIACGCETSEFHGDTMDGCVTSYYHKLQYIVPY